MTDREEDIDDSPQMQLFRGLALADGFSFHALVTPTPAAANRLVDDVVPFLRSQRDEVIELERLTPFPAGDRFPFDYGQPAGVAEIDRQIIEPLAYPSRAVDRSRVRVITILDLSCEYVVHAHRDEWAIRFAILNQGRNTISRRSFGSLVALFPPGLELAFAANAPDFWSIRSSDGVIDPAPLAQPPPPLRRLLRAAARALRPIIAYRAPRLRERLNEAKVAAFAEDLDTCRAALSAVLVDDEVDGPLLEPWERECVALVADLFAEPNDEERAQIINQIYERGERLIAQAPPAPGELDHPLGFGVLERVALVAAWWLQEGDLPLASRLARWSVDQFARHGLKLREIALVLDTTIIGARAALGSGDSKAASKALWLSEAMVGHWRCLLLQAEGLRQAGLPAKDLPDRSRPTVAQVRALARLHRDWGDDRRAAIYEAGVDTWPLDDRDLDW
jgi:hypothetical protein